MDPPPRRMTRSAAKNAAAPPQVPTPPTTGRPPTKRARQAVEEDIDETPVKKGKGKGKGKETVGLADEEPEEEEHGEAEDVGDEDVYDPEGEALGEMDEDDENDEGDEEDIVSSSHPVAKNAGPKRRRQRPSIKFPRSLGSLTAISASKIKRLESTTDAQKRQCLDEFQRRMEHIIRERSALARSSRPNNDDFPMSPQMRQWWRSMSEKEIWTLVQDAVSQGRRMVLGGIWLGYYKFIDIPPVTEEELEMWFVYSDLVDNAAIYVGSATADPNSGAGFSRLGDYERAKRRSNDGIDVSIETKKSRHLRVALQKGAVMNVRVLAVFDPLKVTARIPIAVEGMFVDYLQSFDRSWVWNADYRIFSSTQCLSATVAASENDSPWTGLNSAHPLKQGVRSDSCKRRCLDKQDWTCEVCLLCRPGTAHRTWVPSERFPLIDCTKPYVCRNCTNAAERHPGYTLEQIRVARSASGYDNLDNVVALRDHGLTVADFDARLEAQNRTCPCCLKKGPARDEINCQFSQVWSHMDSTWSARFGEAYWICSYCFQIINSRQGREPLEEIIQDLRRKQSHMVILDASMPTASRGSKMQMDRHWVVMQEKFDLAVKQNGKCMVCQLLKWNDVVTVEGMTSDKAALLPDTWPEGRGLACNSCKVWFVDIQAGKQTGNLADLIAARRAKYAAASEAGGSGRSGLASKQAKFVVMKTQDHCCAVCGERTWDGVETALGMDAFAKWLPEYWVEHLPALACAQCYAFVNTHKDKSDFPSRLSRRRADKAATT